MKSFVLVIEDDPDTLATLQDVLEAREFPVIAAMDGQDAIAQIRAAGIRPGIILLDLRMPVMDGETFLAAQASEPLLVGVPVVIMSAQLPRPDLVPPSVCAVLRKPVSLEMMVDLVRRECGRALLTQADLANGTWMSSALPRNDNAIGAPQRTSESS